MANTANNQRVTRAAPIMVARTEYALHALSQTFCGCPPAWEAVARLRLAHPEASLTELAALTDPPTTKDAIAGVLRRLWDRAEQGDWYDTDISYGRPGLTVVPAGGMP